MPDVVRGSKYPTAPEYTFPYSEVYESPDYWCGEIGYRSPGYGDFIANVVKEIIIMSQRPQSVLDLGCAYGFTVGRLNALGILARGIDCSALAISRANDMTKPYLTRAVVWDLPFASGSFDLAFSSGMLEHVPVEYREKAIKEICRVCHRGVIGVSAIDADHPNTDASHQDLIPLEEWRKMFPPDFKVILDSDAEWARTALLITRAEFYRGRINAV